MYLYGIHRKLIENLLQESTIHADETTLQVLHEPNREATQKSYEWVYRTGRDAERQIIVYDYQETREQSHPQVFLKDYKGLLHTDGYQAYHNLPQGIIIVGFSTFAFGKSRPSGVRPSCRCLLGACPAGMGKTLENDTEGYAKRLRSGTRPYIYKHII